MGPYKCPDCGVWWAGFEHRCTRTTYTATSVEVDEADLMCPNCQTPWKCNGPHLSDQTPHAKRQAVAQ